MAHIFDEHSALFQVQDVKHVDEAVLVARVRLDPAERVGLRLHFPIVGENRRSGESLGFPAWAKKMPPPQHALPLQSSFVGK